MKKQEFKIGQPIFRITITNARDSKSYKPNGVAQEKFNIIGLSEYKICLDDAYFTTINRPQEGRRKDKYYSYPNEITVTIRADNSLLGDGVFITLYSTRVVTQQILNKMAVAAAKKIEKKYGFLTGNAKQELYTLVDTYVKQNLN